jgi:hypothetical protein
MPCRLRTDTLKYRHGDRWLVTVGEGWSRLGFGTKVLFDGTPSSTVKYCSMFFGLTPSSNFDIFLKPTTTSVSGQQHQQQRAPLLFLDVMFFKVRPEWQAYTAWSEGGQAQRASDDLFMRRHRVPDTLMGMRLALALTSWPIGWMD